MLFNGIMVLAAALFGGQSAASERPAGSTLPVSWSVTPVEAQGQAQLRFTYESEGRRSDTSRTVTLAHYPGLSAATLAQGGPVGFRLEREAGTLDCSGTASRGSASGTCAFRGDEAFARALEQRGLSRPTALEQLHLTLHPIGLAEVDELRRQNYATPDVGELIAMGIHGADAAYLRELDSAGYRAGTVGNLLAMRIHGVSAAYVAALAEASPRLRGLQAEALLAMRIHGVTPQYVREMASAGYADASADQLVAFRIHGVTPDFARQANAMATAR